jgi:hypothetical protein
MDFYKTLASKVFEVPEEQVTADQRQTVKLALLYTMYEGKARDQEFLDKILGQFVSDSKNFLPIERKET